MRLARTARDRAAPGIRYALSTQGTRHVMLVSQPHEPDRDLDGIAANCPWAMRAVGLQDAMEAIERAVDLVWRSGGDGRFDSIDFVGHGHPGGLTLGRSGAEGGNSIWLDPQVLMAFTTLRDRLRDDGSVVRLLGCSVARPVPRSERNPNTDAELLCTALARMADHTLEASQETLSASDFCRSGLRSTVKLARYDRDGRLLAFSGCRKA